MKYINKIKLTSKIMGSDNDLFYEEARKIKDLLEEFAANQMFITKSTVEEDFEKFMNDNCDLSLISIRVIDNLMYEFLNSYDDNLFNMPSTRQVMIILAKVAYRATA
jgi:hypothetical protein